MWEELKISPVEIALPKGVGYTLRAYRLSNELTPTEVVEEEDDFAILKRHEDEEEDDFDLVDERPGVHEPRSRRDDDELDDDELDSDVVEEDESDSSDEDADDELDEPDDSVDEDEDSEEEEPEPEEVPAFLGHQGKLLLFRS